MTGIRNLFIDASTRVLLLASLMIKFRLRDYIIDGGRSSHGSKWICMEVIMYALIEYIRSSLVVPVFVDTSFVRILSNAHKVTLNNP